MENEPCLHNGKRPPPKKKSGPDSSEAWLVALAASFINFIMAGLGRTSGILYVALIDIFQTDRREASLPFSVRSSMRNLLGPLVGILGQKYGVRPVIIAGGIVGTLSAAACFNINDIIWLTVVWGGINGVGTALTTTLPQVVISQHFEKYKSTASGIAFSGGCVGSFIFPFLIEYYLFNYDIGGTFLLIGGTIMNVLPAAMILKSPSWWNDKNITENQELAIKCKAEQNTNASCEENEAREKIVEFANENLPQTDADITMSNNMLCNTPLLYDQKSERQQSFKCNINSDFLWQNRYILIKILTDNFTLRYEQSDNEPNKFLHTDDDFLKEIELSLRKLETNVSNGDVDLVNSCGPSAKTEFANCAGSECIHFTNVSVKTEEINAEFNTISIHYTAYYLEKLFERDRNDILPLFSEEQQKIINKMYEDLEKLQNNLKRHGNNYPEFLGTNRNGTENSTDQSNTFYSHIKTACRLYTKPMFLLICLCRAIHFMTFMPAVTIIVDFAQDKGLSLADGKFVIWSLSFGDLVGRLCFGWITDWGYVSLPRYMLFVMLLQGAATIALPLMSSKSAIMISIAVFGLLQGSGFVRHPVLVSRYVAKNEQYIAMGCINLFSGIIGLILPVYIGFFRDSVGSYDGLFYINGAIGAFIGLLWLFEPYCFKLYSSSDPNGNQPSQV